MLLAKHELHLLLTNGIAKCCSRDHINWQSPGSYLFSCFYDNCFVFSKVIKRFTFQSELSPEILSKLKAFLELLQHDGLVGAEAMYVAGDSANVVFTYCEVSFCILIRRRWALAEASSCVTNFAVVRTRLICTFVCIFIVHCICIIYNYLFLIMCCCLLNISPLFLSFRKAIFWGIATAIN